MWYGLSFSGEDAYRKIKSGATLVQLYTGLVYEGPSIIPRIKVLLSLLVRTFLACNI